MVGHFRPQLKRFVHSDEYHSDEAYHCQEAEQVGGVVGFVGVVGDDHYEQADQEFPGVPEGATVQGEGQLVVGAVVEAAQRGQGVGFGLRDLMGVGTDYQDDQDGHGDGE